MSMKKLWKNLQKTYIELQQIKVQNLTQKDFNNGTLLLNEDNRHYQLKENIIFHPNAQNDFLPRKDQPEYQTLGFSLGFFAVISISGKNILLDLNGFTISASEEFTLQQRFFSIIELADAPFIPGEGPGIFSSKITSGKNVIISNGTLGLSSHHGIHGNLAENILIEKLTIQNFEFVGLALNGCSNVAIKDVQIKNNRQNVPVMATYSAARFLKMFSNHLLSKNILTYDITNALKDHLKPLEEEMNATLKEVKNKQKVTSKLFGNVTGLPDGNVFGLLIKNPGFAVNDFSSSGLQTKNIFLYNVRIENLKCKVDEVISLSTQNGTGALTDVAGAVLQIDKIKQGEKYQGTVLSNLQIYLSKICADLKISLGKNNISQDIIAWSEHKISFSQLLKKGYVYKCGSDSMNHLGKGIIGYRLEGLDNVYMKNCSTGQIENQGNLGLVRAGCKNHDLAKRPGYFGANTVGINISYCSNIVIRKFTSQGLVSKNGDTLGINVLFNSKVTLAKIQIKDLVAGTLKKDGRKNDKWIGTSYEGSEVDLTKVTLPNRVPKAFGIKTDKSSKVQSKKVQIDNVTSP